MSTLVVPELDEEPWPTLGPQVVDFIEAHGVYGPGELAGAPYVVTPDFEAFLYRAYEVYPQGHRNAGRRRFKRCYLEERKGTAKTEKAMLVALAEAHPDGPVRCDGFDAGGEPVGIGLRFPYVPLLSYTVEQTEDLGFNVLRYIIENSDLADDFDTGLERILVLDRKARSREAGKLTALAGSPNSRDGARTTFQHFDEPHRMTLTRLQRAHSTMVENTYKRVGADAWTLYTSTAGDPNEESVARDMRQYAELVIKGEVDDPRLFFFSRSAPLEMPMETPEEVRAFLLEASGPNASWSGDIDALVSRWFEPKTDRAYYRRVWGNQWVPGGDKAFDADAWRACAWPAEVPDGTLIVAFFDGSRWDDHSALVGTVVETGYQFVIGHWEPGDDGISEGDVDRAIDSMFDRWDVWRLYCDPPHWEDAIDRWRGRHGARQVIDYFTNRPRPMAQACRLYRAAILDGSVSNDGNEAMAVHIGNAYKRAEVYVDEESGEPLWTIRKERPDSPNKIDLAVCGVGSWEARGDAIAAGAKPRSKGAWFV
ncbi:MAG: terminase [Acidimicrobiia bacterium]